MSAPAWVAHLSTAELGQRYRAARQPIERSHLQIVWLLSQGRSEREVAAATGYGQRWITEIMRRYNTEGTGGLGDQRAKNTGARPLLSQEDEVTLQDALAEPPADGGLWTGPKVAAWMTARLGRKIWPQRSIATRSTGLSAEARLQLAGAPPAARQGGERGGARSLQKGLASRVDEHRAENPERPVEVWAFDG